MFYGGTQRVIWYLGKELVKLGHNVTYLVKKGSSCEFAKTITLNEEIDIRKQIPNCIDVIHFNFTPKNFSKVEKPYIITMHGNTNQKVPLNRNTVFISKNHAERYNSKSFVYNGLDWDDYSKPDFKKHENTFHFLGKASWGVKNLKGAIQIVKQIEDVTLNVLGGKRFSKRVFKMGPSYLFSKQVKYRGMVGGIEKEKFLNVSRGLIFPALWHEPFGLAIIESLFYGCPVFGTPHGSLKELVTKEVGFLSCKKDEIADAIINANDFNLKICSAYAYENFNSKKMALDYLEKYNCVLKGQPLNPKKPELICTQKEKYLEFE